MTPPVTDDMIQNVELTAHEYSSTRMRAVKQARKDLEDRKPLRENFQTEVAPAAKLVTSVLLWTKLFVPVIALLAAVASSVRTIQTASEIYTASGSHPIGVALAAIAFTLSVEGALFVLALASEGERLKLRAAGQPRRVLSLKTIHEAILVRLGRIEPPRYDELPEKTSFTSVMAIAFLFAVAANAYMGLRPLLEEIGTMSLQAFIGTIWQAPADLQMAFIVDVAAILFPPLMALSAGHLTARFAAEIAEQSQSGQIEFDQALEEWRVAYGDPLSTNDGQRLLKLYIEDKKRSKAKKQVKRQGASSADFLSSHRMTNGNQSD